MVSDVAGSSGSAMKGSFGTGLPGPLVSLLKEFSSTRLFKKQDAKGCKEFSVYISKLFNGTRWENWDSKDNLIPLKFDLRTEMGVAHASWEANHSCDHQRMYRAVVFPSAPVAAGTVQRRHSRLERCP